MAKYKNSGNNTQYTVKFFKKSVEIFTIEVENPFYIL